MNTSRTCAACTWLSEMILKLDELEQKYVTLNQEFATKINQGVQDNDIVTFAGIITAGLVDGVDVSLFKTNYDAFKVDTLAFKADYDIRMSDAESDIATLEGIVAGDLVIGKLNINADKNWNAKNITNIGNINGVDIDAFKSDYDAKVNQEVKSTSSPTFAAISVTGNVDGVDVSAFKSDYDSRMATAEQDIDDLEGIVAGDLVIGKLNVNANKDWGAYNITNMGALGVNGNITVGGTVDGVDIAALKTAYDTNINQAVKTTSSPTFAAATVNGNITVTGTVDGVDVLALNNAYNTNINQAVKSTSSPIFQNVIMGSIGSSETLQISNDTERTRVASASYVVMKRTLINSFMAGTIRVKWDMRCSNSLGTVYGQVFINGVAVGVEKSVAGITYNTMSDDLTVALKPGDEIQVYYKIGTYSASFKNFRLYFTPAAKSVIAEAVFNY